VGHHSIATFRTAAELDVAGDSGASQSAALLIGELESRRLMLGRSVTDIAERCEIDAALLSRWVHGDDVPRLDAVHRWAAALGLHVVLVPPEREARAGLRVDWPGRRVAVDGKPVRLTPMEWKALERLAGAPGQVVTHQALFRHLYGEDRDYRAQSTAIRVLITKLRRLLPLRIEAQWGKGYVLTGLAPSLPEGHPGACEERDGMKAAAAPSHAGGAPGSCGLNSHATATVAPTAATAGAALAAVANKAASRVARAPVRRAAARAEELGVIERFLAERGATRCPDVAAIQHSPLPTLVWDKAKRKWVRPAASGCEAV
jgi:transcriptional regulator with XRE-family HTH domain